MTLTSTVVRVCDTPSRTKRRESLKTVSSRGNPSSEALPMNTKIPQRRSLPDHLDDSDTITVQHSNQAQFSHHMAPPASVFPAVTRTGWFTFITDRIRPTHHRPHLLSFESLTKIRCFGEILIRLSDDSINKERWLKCRGYESPLHLLLQYRPPLTVVNTVILELKHLGQECPEAMCDAKGRNSLHIACATVPCNSVAVVARLLNGQTILQSSSSYNPAAVRDKHKMLPLHHACNGKVTKSDLESRVLIIRFLTECYPQGVLLQNNRGMTPSDLVRKNGSNPEILMILYHAMVDQRKAASASTLHTKRSGIDMTIGSRCNALNSDLVQKYTKSEHRRDGLAAFVQSYGPIMKVPKHRSPFAIGKDEMSDFESMDTFSCIDDISLKATRNVGLPDPNRNRNNDVTSKSDTNQADITTNDDVSEMDSVYTFGFIADDYSVIEHETSADLSQDTIAKNIPSKHHANETHEKSMKQSLDINSDTTAKEKTDTEASESSDAAKEYLHSPEECKQNEEQENTMVDDTLEYSNSETDNDAEVLEIPVKYKSETMYSLSKYFDTQMLKPVASEIDTSSVSLNSLTIDAPSTSTSYDETTTTSSDSPSSKKSVRFNDCVQIYNITKVLLDTDDDDNRFVGPSKNTWMDHTDPTESETNPLDDSDRGSVIEISEVTAATVTSSSLMMQRYRHGNVGEIKAVDDTHQLYQKHGRRSTTIDTTALFFL